MIKSSLLIKKEISRRRIVFLTLLVMFLIAFCMDVLLGSVSISLKEIVGAVFNGQESDYGTIILKFRIPKAITAVVVGLALSVSGLQMQTIFRNPMAGPYVLGVSSGASLGVAMVILGFSGSVTPGNLDALGNWSLVIASWIGAGAVMMLIMYISLKVGDILTVLILGIMLASGISAVVSILQYFSSESMLKAYVIWTMGSLGNLTSHQLQVLCLSVLAGLLLSVSSVKMLNALLLGESYAASLGVNIRLTRMLVFSATSILAGSITAFCGPIGFIGIAVPHIARIVFRTSDHRILVPSVMLIGPVIMLASDIISQLPGSGKILPVNSVTALIGIPVVIWVILKNRKYSAA